MVISIKENISDDKWSQMHEIPLPEWQHRMDQKCANLTPNVSGQTGGVNIHTAALHIMKPTHLDTDTKR